MDEDLQYLIDEVNGLLCGYKRPLAMAYTVPIPELHPDIVGLKHSEMYYNKQTEIPLVYWNDAGKMVIWLLPRR